MAEQILLSIADVRQYRQLSKQVNQESFDGHVLTVQRNQLRDLLGAALYKDFIDNIVNANYQDLYLGDSYTNPDGEVVDYYGIKPFLAWHFLSNYITDGSLKQADLGNVNFSGGTFNLASSTQLKDVKSEYLTCAARAQNDIIDYLDQKKAEFPLWKNGQAKQEIAGYDFLVI